MDYKLRLKQYDENILNGVCNNVMQNGNLPSKEKLLLERMIQQSYNPNPVKLKDLLNPSDESFDILKKYLKIKKKDYKTNIGTIRGKTLENYVAALFDISLDDHRTYMRSNIKVSTDKQEIDLIILAKKEDFLKSLFHLSQKNYFELEY